MKQALFSSIVSFCFAAVTLFCAENISPDKDGFITIFDGKTVNGWHISAKSGHSRASTNTTGGKWVVENGAIVGSQDIKGNGGLLITDEQFENFEIVLEMNNDYGPDSGLFLRSTEDGTAWQAMIDYHNGGNLMGLYGEGKLGAKPSIRNFSFVDSPETIKIVTNAPTQLAVSAEGWKFFWRHGQWNELRARIESNPPHITTWINGVMIMDWTDPMPRRHPDNGGIALQVHGGDHTREFVRYRNIRVKKLEQKGPERK